jgi:hypothetical protein
MTKTQNRLWNALASLDSGAVLASITNYRGMQLLDDGFAEFLVDEGLLEPEEDEEDKEGEEEQREPGEDDYVISDCGPLGSKTAVLNQSGWADRDELKVFDAEEEAVKAIRADMVAQKIYSSVWREDDHGGLALWVGFL